MLNKFEFSNFGFNIQIELDLHAFDIWISDYWVTII